MNYKICTFCKTEKNKCLFYAGKGLCIECYKNKQNTKRKEESELRKMERKVLEMENHTLFTDVNEEIQNLKELNENIIRNTKYIYELDKFMVKFFSNTHDLLEAIINNTKSYDDWSMRIENFFTGKYVPRNFILPDIGEIINLSEMPIFKKNKNEQFDYSKINKSNQSENDKKSESLQIIDLESRIKILEDKIKNLEDGILYDLNKEHISPVENTQIINECDISKNDINIDERIEFKKHKKIIYSKVPEKNHFISKYINNIPNKLQSHFINLVNYDTSTVNGDEITIKHPIPLNNWGHVLKLDYNSIKIDETNYKYDFSQPLSI